MKGITLRWSGCLAAALATSCAQPPAPTLGAGVDVALQSISTEDMLEHIRTLSSDEFEGRSVGTHGGELTMDYLVAEFQRIGLAPGNPDGTYLQRVPLTGHVSVAHASATVAGKRFALKVPDDAVAWSYRREPQVQVHHSPLVFIGYGVKAPEYGWDDFKGMDLHGKTAQVLINDPQIPDPKDPRRLDDAMFKGREMTYYGRWTYKYEEAAARGADAMLIIHETATAAYPYQVVINSNFGESFEIRAKEPNPHFPPVPGWITFERARALVAAAGGNLDALKRAALRRDFKPVALDATVDIDVDKKWRELDASNVVGRIEGADPKLGKEVVIYSAHWDHFGWDANLPGSKHDQVFHGASDNASGVAALLELAKAFKALPQAPRRTILFMATTAEERGLLGALYYAEHPLYPLSRTLADINIDGINTWGPTRNIEVYGWGQSDLDDVLVRAARTQGRSVVPDQNPELGGFYRADHFEFARAGVPALYTRSGLDFIGKPAGFGASKRAEYIRNDYHKVTDVIKPDWNLSGAAQDVQLLFLVGYDVAQGDAWPQWKTGSEFKPKRDATMAAGR